MDRLLAIEPRNLAGLLLNDWYPEDEQLRDAISRHDDSKEVFLELAKRDIVAACETAYKDGRPNERSAEFWVPVDSKLVLHRSIEIAPGQGQHQLDRASSSVGDGLEIGVTDVTPADVILKRQGLVVNIRRSKTDQEAVGRAEEGKPRHRAWRSMVRSRGSGTPGAMGK